MGLIGGAIKAVIIVVVLVVVFGIAGFAAFVYRARKLKATQADDLENDPPPQFSIAPPTTPYPQQPKQVIVATNDAYGQYFHQVKP